MNSFCLNNLDNLPDKNTIRLLPQTLRFWTRIQKAMLPGNRFGNRLP